MTIIQEACSMNRCIVLSVIAAGILGSAASARAQEQSEKQVSGPEQMNPHKSTGKSYKKRDEKAVSEREEPQHGANPPTRKHGRFDEKRQRCKWEESRGIWQTEIQLRRLPPTQLSKEWKVRFQSVQGSSTPLHQLQNRLPPSNRHRRTRNIAWNLRCVRNLKEPRIRCRRALQG